MGFNRSLPIDYFDRLKGPKFFQPQPFEGSRVPSGVEAIRSARIGSTLSTCFRYDFLLVLDAYDLKNIFDNKSGGLMFGVVRSIDED